MNTRIEIITKSEINNLMLIAYFCALAVIFSQSMSDPNPPSINPEQLIPHEENPVSPIPTPNKAGTVGSKSQGTAETEIGDKTNKIHEEDEKNGKNPCTPSEEIDFWNKAVKDIIAEINKNNKPQVVYVVQADSLKCTPDKENKFIIHYLVYPTLAIVAGNAISNPISVIYNCAIGNEAQCKRNPNPSEPPITGKGETNLKLEVKKPQPNIDKNTNKTSAVINQLDKESKAKNSCIEALKADKDFNKIKNIKNNLTLIKKTDNGFSFQYHNNKKEFTVGCDIVGESAKIYYLGKGKYASM